MSRMFYSGGISFESPIESEVDARYADLLTAANTNKFDTEQFRRASVRYRHLREPPEIFLWKEAGYGTGTNIFTGALDKAGVNINWTGAVLAHEFGASSAHNGAVSGKPVGHIHASYRSHNWEAGSYEIVLGYSTNNGASYTPFDYSHRFLGYTQADPSPRWSAKTAHPMTNVAATWWSRTMYGKREAHTCYGLMNINSVDPASIDHYAVGIRVNEPTDSNGNGSKDVHELDVCRIWLVGRDNT